MYKLHSACSAHVANVAVRSKLLSLQSSGVGCCIVALYFISEATTVHRPTANGPCDYLKLLHGRMVPEFRLLCLSADCQKGR